MLAKVHHINTSNEVSDIYDSFIRNNYRNSQKTGEEYARRIEEFCNMVFDKSVKFVTAEEFSQLKSVDIESRYVQKLEGNGNSNSTITTKLRSVKSFTTELSRNDISVNPAIFNIKIKKTTKHHQALSKDELMDMYEFMKAESVMGTEKYLIAKTLFITGNRRTATFNMNWSDIEKKCDVSGAEVWVITVKDKGGKVVEKPIADEFYEELCQLKGESEKVFTMNPKTFWRSIKKYGAVIDKDITIHSLKATALTLGYQMTKDINLCKQLGSHSSIATTELYIKEEKSYSNQISFLTSSTQDDSILDSMTHEEMIQFLEENQDIRNLIVNRLKVNKS